MPDIDRADVVLSFEPSDEREHVTIYKVLPVPADKEYAKSVAETFGVDATPQQILNCAYQAADEAGSVVVRSKEDFGFTASGALDSGSREKPTLTEKEARKRAEAFLSERGLWPDDAQFSSFGSAGDPYHEDATEVVFMPPGFTPDSVGPRIAVTFAGDGTIAAVSHDWPELQVVGAYPLISEEDAVERITEGKAWYMRPDSGSPLTLSSVELVFWALPDQDGFTYFMPLYRFKGPDDQGASVSALPDEYIRPKGVNTPVPPTPCSP